MIRLLPTRFYYGWVMVACAFAINSVSSTLNPVVFSFLLGPMSRDLGVSQAEMSISLSLRLLAAGATGPVFGWLIDRFGTRWLGVAAGAIAGGMMLALGFVDRLWIVYAVFAVSGTAGLGGPAGQLLTQVPLAHWFIVNRGRALSIATAGMAIGTVIAIPVTGMLIERLGWRGLTFVYGLVVIGVVLPVSAIFVRRAPEDMGLHPDGADGPPDPDAAPTRASRMITDHDWTLGEAVRTSAFWLMLIALTLSGIALIGSLIYRVGYFQSTGVPLSTVAFGTALDPFCLIFSLMVFSVISDRFPVRYLGVFGLLGFGASIVPMVFATGQTWPVIAHGVIWGIAAGGNITLNSLVWANYFGRRYLGTIRGIVLFVTIAAQAIGGPLYGALLESGLPPARVWEATTATFALCAFLVFLARPPQFRAPIAREEMDEAATRAVAAS